MSVLAEGKAERWPPISLNTWSTPNPLSASFSLSLTLSLFLSLYCFLSLHFSHYSSQAWQGGWQLSASQPVKKGLLFSALPLGQEEYSHTHTHPHTRTPTCTPLSTDMHTHRTRFHKGFVHNSHPLTLSPPLIHAHTQILFVCTQNTCSYKNFWLLLDNVLHVVSVFKMCWHFACTNQDQMHYPYRH